MYLAKIIIIRVSSAKWLGIIVPEIPSSNHGRYHGREFLFIYLSVSDGAIGRLLLKGIEKPWIMGKS